MPVVYGTFEQQLFMVRCFMCFTFLRPKTFFSSMIELKKTSIQNNIYIPHLKTQKHSGYETWDYGIGSKLCVYFLVDQECLKQEFSLTITSLFFRTAK